MQVAVVAEIPTNEQGKDGHSSRPGGMIGQRLLEDDAPDGLNFRFVRNQFQPGEKAFRSPRHHHAFQQIRFAEKGNLNFAPGQFIPEGDVAYFPRGAYYGPQVKDDGISVALQFGFDGEHQGGAVWDRYRSDALEDLKKRGRFEDGVFVEVDPANGQQRRRDGVQALYEAQYERHTNKRFVIPPEGYEAPILMHPEAFAYYEAAPGVEVKHLGRFYDHPGPQADVRISMIRLSDGGVHHLGSERAQLAWTRSAGLQIDGRIYPELTCVYSPRETDIAISSDKALEVYLVEFPRLD
jgi:hypothetical protein